MAVARNENENEPSGIAAIFAHTKALEGRVDGIERAVDSLGKRMEHGAAQTNDKLDALARAVTTQAAQPQFSLTAMLAVVTMCAGLLGSAAGTTVWIATSISAAPMAELRMELKHHQDNARRLERTVERLTELKLAGLTK